MQNRSETLLQRLYILPFSEAGRRDGKELACLFTQNQVAEVLDGKTPVYPVPFCPAWLKGCIQRAGVLVPVIDVDALCGPGGKKSAQSGGETPAPARQILVLRTGCPDETGGHFLSVALTCRGAIETFRLTERDVAGAVSADEPPESGFDGHGLNRGFFRLRDHRVVLMSFDALAEGTFQAEKKED